MLLTRRIIYSGKQLSLGKVTGPFLCSSVMNIRGLYDGDKDKDDNNKQTTSSFVGGEKSGLAVQNPNNGGDLWQKAAVSLDPPPPGSRKVTVYKDGFRVDDGPFRSLDSPENVEFMDALLSGHAPNELRDGLEGPGPLHLVLENRQHENFEQQPAPTPKYTLFKGAGQCLSHSSTAPRHGDGATVDISRGSVTLNESDPTTTLQFRFHDGSRATQRFNRTHSVAAVHAFVSQCTSVSSQAFTLLTGFPPTAIPVDPNSTIASAGLLNATLTQRLN